MVYTLLEQVSEAATTQETSRFLNPPFLQTIIAIGPAAVFTALDARAQ